VCDLSAEQVRADTPTGLLQPLPIPERKWENSSMDFITGLPKAQGKDDIFVGVDKLTKFARFLAITTNYNAMQVVELFFRETFRLHELPQSRHSGRDSGFINTSEELPPLDEEGQLELVPEEVLEFREWRLRSRVIREC
jgi:hypothetical protein